MMKRFVSVLIVFALILSSSFVASAKNETIDVTLSMYCNLSDKNTVSGKYKDNVFYVSVDTLCDLADATVTEQNNDKVCITVERDSRNCEIFFDSQTLTEEYTGNQSITMPCLKENGQVYISALHFLRCLGADVIIDKNNNPQFVVCFQYNFFEAITEYVNNDLGNFFYWDEIDFGEKDIEDVLVNAGVVALINRDSNIFKMAINPRGIEREALEEVLAVIVKNEGQETFSENDPLLKEIGLANDFLGIDLGVFDILKGAEVLDLPDNFNDFASAETTGISTAVNLLNALETMKQFENVSETQKKLLKDTILTYKDDSPMLCGEWKNIYKAAENVDLRIQNDYTNEFAASCDVAEKTAYTFLDQATGNPVSLAWSCLVYAGKIIGSNIIDKKTQLYNAYNCSMIQYAANELLSKPCADLTDNDHFHFNLSNQQYCYTRAKNSLILQLKSTISTRQYLIESQFLSDSLKKDMEAKIRETAVLLNKVENCKIIPIGVDPVVKEDLAWMGDEVVWESAIDTETEPTSLNAGRDTTEVATFLGENISEVFKKYGNNYTEASMEGGHFFVYDDIEFGISENAIVGMVPPNVVAVTVRKKGLVLYQDFYSDMSYNDLKKIDQRIEKPEYYYSELFDEAGYSTTFTYREYLFTYRWNEYLSADDVCCEVNIALVAEQENLNNDVSIEADKKTCITQMECVDYGWYTGNMGDSCLFNLDKKGLYNDNADNAGYYRNGNVGVDGTEYNNGFEAFLARWNPTAEISYCYATYKLNGEYGNLTGKTSLIQSANTENFNTTVYFYDGEKLLGSYTLTNDDYEKEIDVDVTNVDELKILVQDNVAVTQGTSYALYDMFLLK